MDWIDEIERCTIKNYNKRKIVFWGCEGKTAKKLADRFKEKYSIETAFMVDSNDKLIDDYYVKSITVLDGKREEYYVIVPLKYWQQIIDRLANMGYEKDTDYCYWSECIVKDDDYYYEDLHGNRIVGYHKNLFFLFAGYNATIEITDAMRFSSKCRLHVGSNARIMIGKRNTLNGNFTVKDGALLQIGDNNSLAITEEMLVGEKSKILIGEGNVIKMQFARIEKEGILSIGTNNSFNPRMMIHCPSYTSIFIGDDCMISTDVIFQSSDGHLIFNTETKENINGTKEIASNRKIVINNHVWIGRRSIILYNSIINEGSIIGIGSIVKGIIPNNCIAVGNPAKIVRKNIAWSRTNDEVQDITACGEEYIGFTRLNME